MKKNVLIFLFSTFVSFSFCSKQNYLKLRDIHKSIDPDFQDTPIDTKTGTFIDKQKVISLATATAKILKNGTRKVFSGAGIVGTHLLTSVYIGALLGEDPERPFPIRASEVFHLKYSLPALCVASKAYYGIKDASLESQGDKIKLLKGCLCKASTTGAEIITVYAAANLLGMEPTPTQLTSFYFVGNTFGKLFLKPITP
jgi:hypothetical protein